MPVHANPTDRRGRVRIKIWLSHDRDRNKMWKGNRQRHLATVMEVAAFWEYFLWGPDGAYNTPITINDDEDERWQKVKFQLNETIERWKAAKAERLKEAENGEQFQQT
jgi:hypothetical protein